MQLSNALTNPPEIGREAPEKRHSTRKKKGGGPKPPLGNGNLSPAVPGNAMSPYDCCSPPDCSSSILRR